METKKVMRSYFFQITGVLFILICLVISALAFTADRVTISRVESQTERQSAKSVEVSSNALRKNVGKLHENLMNLQLYVNDPAELQRRVDQFGYLNDVDGFKSLFYYDLDKNTFTWLTGEERQVSEKAIRQDDAFARAFGGGEFYMSPRYRIDADYVTYMYVAVQEGKDQVGIFGGGISLMNSSLFRNSLESFDDETIAYLFNSQGEPLATSRNLVTDSERVLSRSIVERAFETTESFDIFSSNKDMYYFANDLKVTDWKILVRTPRSNFYEPVYTTRQQYLIIATLTLVLSLIVGYLMSRQLTAPLLELVQKIETNTTPQPIELERSGSNEVKTLVSAYNDYARRMESSRLEQLSQQQLILQQEKLASLGQLAAGIAHEIRNPLTPVQITLQMIAERSEEDAEMTKVALSELRRANDLIQTMLDLSKGDQRRYEKKWIDMEQFMNQFRFIVEAEAYNQPVICKIYTPSSIPSLYAAEDALLQILSNCVRNAIDAVEGKGSDGVCHIHLQVYPDEFLFIVQDNGVGMTKEQLGSLGRKFATTKVDGNGFGIYMSKEIIKQQGGRIEFESEVGVGTKVLIHFPRAEEDET